MVTDRSLCGSESETLRKPSAALVLGGQSAERRRLLKMPKIDAGSRSWLGPLGKRQYFETLFLVFGIRLLLGFLHHCM